MCALARLCAAVLACLLLAPTLVAQELTEREALAQFAEVHPRVRMLQFEVEQVRAENQARSLLTNPAVVYTHESAAGSRDDFLLLRQELPVTGRLRLLRAGGKAAVDVAQASASFDLQSLRAQVRLSFVDLLLAQEREVALRDGVRELQEVVRILAEREQQGEGSTFDQLRGARELAELQADRSSAAVIRAQAQARLASFLGSDRDPTGLVAQASLTAERVLPPLAALLDRALQRRKDYERGTLDLRRYETERRAAERLRLPQPALSAGMKRTSLGSLADTGWTLSVDVTVPLFNRGQTDTAHARAAIGRVGAEQEALRLQIQQEVRAAYVAASVRRQQVDDYLREAAETSHELARIAQLAYEEGEVGILELLDAYRVSRDARLRAVDLLASVRYAEIELDRTVGEEVLP